MRHLFFLLCFFETATQAANPPRFKVATYNVENYLITPSGTRSIKPESHRVKVVESIVVIQPDILVLEEIGRTNSLFELKDRLKKAGLDLPHWEHISGYDTNIFVALLSRFPLIARRPHTNLSFLLEGRRFRTSRGFLEVDLEPFPSYQMTLFAAHLKSKRVIAHAEEAALREQESILLRRLIDQRIQAFPAANILVCGDFNDTKDSPALRTLLARQSRSPLIDTRPVERNGDQAPSEKSRWEPRHVAWTHYYGKEDTYGRLDYILVNAAMGHEWRREGSYIPIIPNWGMGSDHRPIVCEFEAIDQ